MQSTTPPAPNTVSNAPEERARTGRKQGTKITNEAKEHLYCFWVKHGCLGSGEFESLLKRKLNKTTPVDGLLLVFEDELPFTSQNDAIGYKAEFSKRTLLFSGLATMLTGFIKRFEQEQK